MDLQQKTKRVLFQTRPNVGGHRQKNHVRSTTYNTGQWRQFFLCARPGMAGKIACRRISLNASLNELTTIIKSLSLLNSFRKRKVKTAPAPKPLGAILH